MWIPFFGFYFINAGWDQYFFDYLTQRGNGVHGADNCFALNQCLRFGVSHYQSTLNAKEWIKPVQRPSLGSQSCNSFQEASSMTMPSSSRCGPLHDQSYGFQFIGWLIYHVRRQHIEVEKSDWVLGKCWASCNRQSWITSWFCCASISFDERATQRCDSISTT